jgi:hypothetical protein
MTTPKDNTNTNPSFIETFMAFKYEVRLIKNAQDEMLIVLVRLGFGLAVNNYFLRINLLILLFSNGFLFVV